LLHPRARVESFKCQRAAKKAIFPAAAQLESAIQRRREVKEQLLKGRVGLAGVDFKIPLAPQIAALS
jgi:hypothetical protein